MNIRIESLSVNGLGPIASIKWQFKDINLIYGRNERGKTYLAEYLLRSLFKHAQNTRDLTDSGQVIVSGLTGEITPFTPKSRKKIEDFIFSSDDGKPIDLSRLCVVKGGELSFLPYNEKSITKDVLKEYLSDQRILDGIQKEISLTIQESSWENGQIIGKKQIGPIKELNNGVQQLRKIDELLREVDEAYSLGEVKKLKSELEVINKLIKEQQQARKAYAYSLSEQFKVIESELSQIPLEDLDEVKNLQTKIEGKRDLIKDGQAELEALEPRCENYLWLKAAIEQCEKRPEAFTGKAGLISVILSIIGTLAAIVFAFLGIPFLSLGAGLVAILFVILAVLQYRSKLRSSADIAEVDRIFQEYETKFGLKARSIAALRSTFDNLSPIYYGLQKTIDQIKDHKKDLSELEKALKSKLTLLIDNEVGSEDLTKLIHNLQKKRNQLEKQCEELKGELAKTQVQPEEYISEVVETRFELITLKKYEQQKIDLEQSISGKVIMLDTLKQRVCDITADMISLDWDELIDHLRNKREEVSQSTKKVESHERYGHHNQPGD